MSEGKNCHSRTCNCGSKRLDRFLVPSVLLLLSEESSYGYELTEKYSKMGFSYSENDFGAIYRTLKILEKQGFIKSKWEINRTGPAKKNYSITEKGSIELEKWVEFIRQRENIFKIFLDRFSNLKNQKEDQVE